MKNKRTIEKLDNVITTNAIEVGQIDKRAAHNKAISKGTKEYYQSEAGILEKKARSERTKNYWASPEGQAKKERLRQRLKK